MYCVNCNFMVTLFCVYSDYVDHRCAQYNNWYGIITLSYWILEKSSDFIEATIRYTNLPNKIFNIFYMLLLRFCREYNLAPPWAFTLFNPIILQKITDLIHCDLWFMRYIPWHFTTHSWGYSGIDCECVPNNCTTHSRFSETVPVIFIILMTLYLDSAVFVSPIFIPLVRSSQSSPWLYVIISFRVCAFQSTFGLNTAFLWWL